jgi:hypothetical protein
MIAKMRRDVVTPSTLGVVVSDRGGSSSGGRFGVAKFIASQVKTSKLQLVLLVFWKIKWIG